MGGKEGGRDEGTERGRKDIQEKNYLVGTRPSPDSRIY